MKSLFLHIAVIGLLATNNSSAMQQVQMQVSEETAHTIFTPKYAKLIQSSELLTSGKTTQNETEIALACELLNDVAEQDIDQNAQIDAWELLGELYYYGAPGIESNLTKAREYFQKIAQQKLDADRARLAHKNLATIYDRLCKLQTTSGLPCCPIM